MPRASQNKRAPKSPPIPPSNAATTTDIDPRWLLKMLGLVLGAALFCGYLTLCLLFYQGQWQLVLHPTPGDNTAPTVPFEDVSFDYTETGQAQLHGWWIPAPPAAPGAVPTRYSAVTVLYLHDGSTTLSASLPKLQELHNAGLNVFAFDYRGFGRSTGPHPNELRMMEDTDAAFYYVSHNRRYAVTQIIPYGDGLGGALAVHLAQQHPRVPSIILSNPVFDVGAIVRADPRTELIPVRLLLRERFEIAKPLASLPTPKLLLLDGDAHAPSAEALAAVADPKFAVHLTGESPDESAAALHQSLSRFLDEYLPDPALIPQ